MKIFTLTNVATLFLIITTIEIVAFKILHRSYPYRHIIRSVIYLSILLTFQYSALYSGYFQFVYNNGLRFFEFGSIFNIILGLIILDFCQYISHYLSHKYSLFWVFHVVHHAPNRLNSLMSSVFSICSYLFNPIVLLYSVVLLLGLAHIKLLILYRGIYLFHQIFIHIEFFPKLKHIEYVFNTPSLHRIHHSIVLENQHKNLGAVLSIFDRIFSTYQPETIRIEQFGLDKDSKDDGSILYLLKCEYEAFQNLWKHLWSRS